MHNFSQYCAQIVKLCFGGTVCQNIEINAADGVDFNSINSYVNKRQITLISLFSETIGDVTTLGAF